MEVIFENTISRSFNRRTHSEVKRISAGNIFYKKPRDDSSENRLHV